MSIFEADKLEPDYADAFQAWKASPTPATNSKLLTAVHPVIQTALQSYGGSSAASPTLRSKARQMALHAFQSYDPSRGRLRTHLLSQLQSLRRAAAKEQNIIGLPEQVGLDYQHLTQAENELRDQLGRDPSDAETADHTGLSFKRLAYIRQARMPVAEGTSEVPDAEGNMSSPASALPGADDSLAWQEFVYHDLGTTDKVIMDYVLGRHGSPRLPPGEIAKRLGITVGAVSQRTAKMQKLLDQRNEMSVL